MAATGGVPATRKDGATARNGGSIPRRPAAAVDQGRQNGKQLFAEMRQRGYIGSFTGLLRLLAEWRTEKTCAVQLIHSTPKVVAMRHVSPQEAAALLSFRSILRRGKVASLKRWLERAKAAGITSMSRFVRQLKKDWPPVENAVANVWSNGPTEGHINRLKTLKRQMSEEPALSSFAPGCFPWPREIGLHQNSVRTV